MSQYSHSDSLENRTLELVVTSALVGLSVELKPVTVVMVDLDQVDNQFL